MNLLKWKTLTSNGEKIVTAKGVIYQHWSIYVTDKENYKVRLPEGIAAKHGWSWYYFSKLQDAKDACEWWNKEFVLEKFSEEERVTLYKFFEYMNEIEEAHTNEY